MKDEVKEILDYFVIHSTTEELEMLSKISIYITNLKDRIKELEQINEEHRKLNGTLNKTINEAIEYIKNCGYNRWCYGEAEEDLLEILQGKSDE